MSDIKSLTREELSRLLIVAKRENPLHWLAITVAFTHGLRASEICEMEAGQVREGYLFVKRKKGSEATHQRLIGEEKEALISRVSLLSPKDRVFPFSTRWFQKIMNKYGRMAGIPQLKSTPHKLKHTCALLSIEGGMKLHELKEYLGHKSLESTGEYLKITQEKASEAFAKAMGL